MGVYLTTAPVGSVPGANSGGDGADPGPASTAIQTMKSYISILYLSDKRERQIRFRLVTA